MAEKDKKIEKFYTPQEVAVAILKKAEELLKNSSLVKSNTSHEVEAGEEPNNDDAEAPEYLANADIEDSGTHGEKKKKKGKSGIEGADKDGDGDIDGDDAVEAQEEISGEDLDGDEEAGESEDHKDKVDAASKTPKEDDDGDSDLEDKVDDVVGDEEEGEEEEGEKKPPFAKSEKGVHAPSKYKDAKGKSFAGMSARAKLPATARHLHNEKLKELKEMPKPNLPKSEDLEKAKVDEGHSDSTKRAIRAKRHEDNAKTKKLNPVQGIRTRQGEYGRAKDHAKEGLETIHSTKPNLPKSEDGMETDLKKPSLKKFMLKRKMKKSGAPTSDARAAEKLSGAPAAPTPKASFKEQPSPAEKVKAQPKLQMEKNKSTEKMLGIKPKGSVK